MAREVAEPDSLDIPDWVDTQEWVDSLRDVVRTRGTARASRLLQALQIEAQRSGVQLPVTSRTPYVNTVPLEHQPPFPGDNALERRITARTRLLIFNDLQNPTGAESSPAELERVAEFATRHDLLVLCDEAYWDIRYSGASRSLASLPGMAERCLILYTFSKKFAMTGWRLGAALGPAPLMDVIAKLNVNDESCANHFVQYGALEGLTGDQSGPRRILGVLKERRDACVALLGEVPGVTCFTPTATFYLFPNVTGLMERKGLTSYDALRRAALEETGVSFCTRLHFGRALPGEEEKYVRFAYSGIGLPQIEEGLGRLKAWAEA